MQKVEVKSVPSLLLTHSHMGLLAQTEISYLSGKTVCWLDYLPSPGLVLAAASTFCAVGMLDGTLNVYSPTGRR
jgi:hypothetical protein